MPVTAVDANSQPWEERYNEFLGRTLYRKNLFTDPGPLRMVPGRRTNGACATAEQDVIVIFITNKPFEIHYLKEH